MNDEYRPPKPLSPRALDLTSLVLVHVLAAIGLFVVAQIAWYRHVEGGPSAIRTRSDTAPHRNGASALVLDQTNGWFDRESSLRVEVGSDHWTIAESSGHVDATPRWIADDHLEVILRAGSFERRALEVVALGHPIAIDYVRE